MVCVCVWLAKLQIPRTISVHPHSTRNNLTLPSQSLCSSPYSLPHLWVGNPTDLLLSICLYNLHLSLELSLRGVMFELFLDGGLHGIVVLILEATSTTTSTGSTNLSINRRWRVSGVYRRGPLEYRFWLVILQQQEEKQSVHWPCRFAWPTDGQLLEIHLFLSPLLSDFNSIRVRQLNYRLMVLRISIKFCKTFIRLGRRRGSTLKLIHMRWMRLSPWECEAISFGVVFHDDEIQAMDLHNHSCSRLLLPHQLPPTTAVEVKLYPVDKIGLIKSAPSTCAPQVVVLVVGSRRITVTTFPHDDKQP